MLDFNRNGPVFDTIVLAITLALALMFCIPIFYMPAADPRDNSLEGIMMMTFVGWLVLRYGPLGFWERNKDD